MSQKKYVVLTDSACDMPYELAEECGVDILSFHIAVDGKNYIERQDFTFEEYYDILRECKDIPSTAFITMPRYMERFEQYYKAGVKEVLYVAINSTGSATYNAAIMAREKFCQEFPDSDMKIYIVDSHCYSMAYGWFVAEACKKLKAGEEMYDVTAWLNDIFTKVEIVLGAFSLKFMKKSGRVSAAAAIAGELMGVRPIISLNDGVSVVQKKVRGDKEVLPALIAQMEANHAGLEPYMVVGTNAKVMEELAKMCTEKWGKAPDGKFYLGSAVATNTGPDAIAIVYLGKSRRKPDEVNVS